MAFNGAAAGFGWGANSNPVSQSLQRMREQQLAIRVPADAEQRSRTQQGLDELQDIRQRFSGLADGATSSPLSQQLQSTGMNLLQSGGPISDATKQGSITAQSDIASNQFGQSRQRLLQAMASAGLEGSPVAAQKEMQLQNQHGRQLQGIQRDADIGQATQNFGGQLNALGAVGNTQGQQFGQQLQATTGLANTINALPIPQVTGTGHGTFGTPPAAPAQPSGPSTAIERYYASRRR